MSVKDKWTLKYRCRNKKCHRAFQYPRYGKCPFCGSTNYVKQEA